MTSLKTFFFILLVPGFLLGVVPFYVIPHIPGISFPPGTWNWASILLWIVGIAVVIWCAADFVRKGHGTPLLLDPPKELVVNGLYRYVRNPMAPCSRYLRNSRFTCRSPTPSSSAAAFCFIRFSYSRCITSSRFTSFALIVSRSISISLS
jgi:hypothetical protein